MMMIIAKDINENMKIYRFLILGKEEQLRLHLTGCLSLEQENEVEEELPHSEIRRRESATEWADIC